MKLFKIVALTVLAGMVSACSTLDTATRNAPLDVPNLTAPDVQAQPRDYRLEAVRIAIPADMRVSEANSYYPIADIVWRGDPLGDRRAQIADILDTSLRAGGAGLDGERAVIADVTLVRFHSLTERTRYTVGGVHSIKFELTIRDAVTGEVIEAARTINADLPGLGGQAAIFAEQQGQTQKVRITTHLTALFRDYLTGVPGQEAAPLV